VRHRGQLKLLLSEMTFLQPYRGVPHTVVYAGAAPGLHVPILAGMFPEMHFLLIDPHPSAIADGQLPNVVTLEVCMTDQMAAELGARYADARLLFISDVRVGIPVEDEPNEPPREHQARVHRDMTAQMGWYRRLRPKAGLLKFRLPWDLEPQTEYLHGTVLFPVFGRPFTHESRLVVVGPEPATVLYNNTVYERQMAYFNRVTRPATYTGGKCYDCHAFAATVAEHLGVAPRARPVHQECRRIEKELAQITARWGNERKVSLSTAATIITSPTRLPTCDRSRAPCTGRETGEGVGSTGAVGHCTWTVCKRGRRWGDDGDDETPVTVSPQPNGEKKEEGGYDCHTPLPIRMALDEDGDDAGWWKRASVFSDHRETSEIEEEGDQLCHQRSP
jgi:hypothetical protein